MEKLNIQNLEVKTNTYDTNNNEVISAYDTELKKLRALARTIFITLALIIIISGIIIGFKDSLSISLIWTCMIAGTLGSTSSSLISALQRKANGWETEDGKKYPIDNTKSPTDDKREMFSQRMATFFLYRPTLGIIAGLLIYFGMQSKYFGDTGLEDPYKVIFWSLLSGLFVKSLIKKLKDLFDNLVGKK
jgi:hypothetical protein